MTPLLPAISSAPWQPGDLVCERSVGIAGRIDAFTSPYRDKAYMSGVSRAVWLCTFKRVTNAEFEALFEAFTPAPGVRYSCGQTGLNGTIREVNGKTAKVELFDGRRWTVPVALMQPAIQAYRPVDVTEEGHADDAA